MNDLDNYINDPTNDSNNFFLALWYEKQGHFSPASGFYLRCAEITSDINKRYESLLRMYICYRNLGQRDYTCETLLKEAVSLCPQKPEAYFLLTQFYEMKSDWLNVYTYSSIGLDICTAKSTLISDLDFPDLYALWFQKAAAAWWVGKPDEARKLFRLLLTQYIDQLNDKYKHLLEQNLSQLGCGPESVAIKRYNKSMKDKTRISFNNFDSIEHNFSQAYQDLFVLWALQGKQNGRYLEIGAADPFKNSNTALLETQFGWTGVGIEYNQDLANQHKNNRKNPVLCVDALVVDYNKLLQKHFPDTTTIDYLQLDIEPPRNTYEALISIPFDKYKFSIITYEHDYYVDITRSYRDKSRKYLQDLGYVLLVPNIAPIEDCPFEDWWIHSDIAESVTLPKILNDQQTTLVESYFLQ